jgi:uncharacterized protein (TIGR03000 family)
MQRACGFRWSALVTAAVCAWGLGAASAQTYTYPPAGGQGTAPKTDKPASTDPTPQMPPYANKYLRQRSKTQTAPYPYTSSNPYVAPGPYGPGGNKPEFYQVPQDTPYGYSNEQPWAEKSAVVVVKVSLALVDVTINGNKTSLTGKTRVFATPELTAGKSYTYTLAATWTEGGVPRNATRTLQLTAGQTVTVDFTRKE